MAYVRADKATITSFKHDIPDEIIILAFVEPTSSKKGILLISVDETLIVPSLSLEIKNFKLSISKGVDIKSILSLSEYFKSFS